MKSSARYYKLKNENQQLGQYYFLEKDNFLLIKKNSTLLTNYRIDRIDAWIIIEKFLQNICDTRYTTKILCPFFLSPEGFSRHLCGFKHTLTHRKSQLELQLLASQYMQCKVKHTSTILLAFFYQFGAFPIEQWCGLLFSF